MKRAHVLSDKVHGYILAVLEDERRELEARMVDPITAASASRSLVANLLEANRNALAELKVA